MTHDISCVEVYEEESGATAHHGDALEDVDEGHENEDDDEDDNAPVYNPKNLPLGWDGKVL